MKIFKSHFERFRVSEKFQEFRYTIYFIIMLGGFFCMFSHMKKFTRISSTNVQVSFFPIFFHAHSIVYGQFWLFSQILLFINGMRFQFNCRQVEKKKTKWFASEDDKIRLVVIEILLKFQWHDKFLHFHDMSFQKFFCLHTNAGQFRFSLKQKIFPILTFI